MTPIAPLVTGFLRERLGVERCASPHTCDTYAYAIQLLLEFAGERLRVRPSALQFEHIDVPLVLVFLKHLQKERKNGPRTCNARLAAIKSFMKYAEHRMPVALEQIRQVVAIPIQRTDTRLPRHLDSAQTKALLDTPDARVTDGLRDRAMLYLALTGGLRVSELVGLRMDDISFRDRYIDLRIRGKGRKERVLTLWREVADAVRAWLAVRGECSAPEVFLNARGKAMTRSGFEYILRRHIETASNTCPALAKKKVSPHTLRHTCALNTLHATHDIRKVSLWLGHASTQTTEIYLQSDPAERLEVLEAMTPPELKRGKFRPPDKLIASLRQP